MPSIIYEVSTSFSIFRIAKFLISPSIKYSTFKPSWATADWSERVSAWELRERGR